MYKIYKAKDIDLKINNDSRASHLVIVSAYNKRSKNCMVHTITSLDRLDGNGKYKFQNQKLNAVRSGRIIVIPNKYTNSKILTGIYSEPRKIKFNKLEKTDSNIIFPKKYKNIIKK